MRSAGWLCSLVFSLTTWELLAQSKDDDVIYWQTYHRPPGIIKSGEFEGQGFVQLILQQVIDRMPEYHHQMPLTTLARVLQDMQLGKNVCHPSLYKTEERSKFAYFSIPNLINPTNRIIAHSKVAQQFKESSVDLSSLLVNPDYTFALVKGRSFGQEIDNIINTYVNSDRVFHIPNETLATIFHMIRLQRIDFTIVYPFELGYFLKTNENSTDEFVSYTIDGIGEYIVGSIACAKTPWGEKVIAKVNQVLTEIRKTEAYQKAMTTWWESERNKAPFNEFYNYTFLQQ